MRTLLSCLLVTYLSELAVAADPVAPAATISLGARHAHVIPARQGFAHTGGGNIDVAQPSPDVVVITMSGVAVAGGHPTKPSFATMNFELEQFVDVALSQPGLAKITMEGRVIGALRSHNNGGGKASEGPGQASLFCGNVPVATVNTPSHTVACGENVSVNCRTGQVSLLAMPGRVTLKQTWCVSANHPQALFPCKAASSEFAPDPALDPLWISYWEPFHGAIKKDFGFQVILRVAYESDNAATAK